MIWCFNEICCPEDLRGGAISIHPPARACKQQNGVKAFQKINVYHFLVIYGCEVVKNAFKYTDN